MSWWWCYSVAWELINQITIWSSCQSNYIYQHSVELNNFCKMKKKGFKRWTFFIVNFNISIFFKLCKFIHSKLDSFIHLPCLDHEKLFCCCLVHFNQVKPFEQQFKLINIFLFQITFDISDMIIPNDNCLSIGNPVSF